MREDQKPGSLAHYVRTSAQRAECTFKETGITYWEEQANALHAKADELCKAREQ